DTALERFFAPGEWSFFRPFHNRTILGRPNDHPFDAGLVFIDLAARLVMCDSTWSATAREGYVPYHDGKSATEIHLRYHLSSDWEMMRGSDGWPHLAESRRRERKANPPQDARLILMGQPLLEFIAHECLEYFLGRGAPLGSGEAGDAEEEERVAEDAETIREIHARWLLTGRDDLGGRCPREVMLAKHDYISWSLQDREEQWSQTGRCPRGLEPESAAYRFAGFGTTELVVYYDLVRELLWSCRDSAAALSASGSDEALAAEFLMKEVPRLEGLREAWLDEPDPEYNGRTPRQLLHNERARIPEGGSGEEMMIDCDCPLCQMEAASGRVGFWHFDGCNMDDDFAFSIYHDTYEQWQEEQRENEELARKWREKEERRLASGQADSESMPDLGVWQHSFSAAPSEDDPPVVRLFAIGTHLSELIGDLKGPAESRELIDRLNREFGNVLEMARAEDAASAEALLEPVLDRFAETLEVVAAARRDLEPKCADLRRRVQHLLEPPSGSDDSLAEDEDLPY
ncbi:MAG TPA: hypothetical protein VGB13_04070, partial [Candidatus Krumholzibacteria bacterium]